MHDEKSPDLISSTGSPPPVRLVVVHGSGFDGRLVGVLHNLLEEAGSACEVLSFGSGYASSTPVDVPWTEGLAYERLYQVLRVTADDPRVTNVLADGHGTRVLGQALRKHAAEIKVGTVILTSSQLSTSYPWGRLLQGSVGRVVNECRRKDFRRFVSEILDPFLGRSGQIGFAGDDGARLINRHHENAWWSGFGRASQLSESSRELMRRWWVPLLVSDAPPEISERDGPGVLSEKLKESPPPRAWLAARDRFANVFPRLLGVGLYTASLVSFVWVVNNMLVTQFMSYLHARGITGLFFYTLAATPASLYVWFRRPQGVTVGRPSQSLPP